MSRLKILLGYPWEGIEECTYLLGMDSYSTFDIFQHLADTLEDAYRFDPDMAYSYAKTMVERMSQDDLVSYLKKSLRRIPNKSLILTKDLNLAKMIKRVSGGELLRISTYSTVSDIPMEDSEYDAVLDRHSYSLNRLSI